MDDDDADRLGSELPRNREAIGNGSWIPDRATCATTASLIGSDPRFVKTSWHVISCATATHVPSPCARQRLDKRRYPTGKKIPAKEFKTINIKPDDWRGDWNYVIRPREKS